MGITVLSIRRRDGLYFGLKECTAQSKGEISDKLVAELKLKVLQGKKWRESKGEAPRKRWCLYSAEWLTRITSQAKGGMATRQKDQSEERTGILRAVLVCTVNQIYTGGGRSR